MSTIGRQKLPFSKVTKVYAWLVTNGKTHVVDHSAMQTSFLVQSLAQ
jgi:hypothetical protein